MIMSTYLLEPGKYYIGDPGFVFDEKSWEALIRQTQFFQLDQPVEMNNYTLWGHAIKAQRPVFTDQNGVEYRIEDNVIAAIPIELVENPEGEEHGSVLDAPEGLLVNFEDGVFRFNTIVINTNEPEKPIAGGYDLDPAGDSFI